MEAKRLTASRISVLENRRRRVYQIWDRAVYQYRADPTNWGRFCGKMKRCVSRLQAIADQLKPIEAVDEKGWPADMVCAKIQKIESDVIKASEKHLSIKDLYDVLPKAFKQWLRNVWYPQGDQLWYEPSALAEVIALIQRLVEEREFVEKSSGFPVTDPSSMLYQMGIQSVENLDQCVAGLNLLIRGITISEVENFMKIQVVMQASARQGTQLVGYVDRDITYQRIVKVFGPSQISNDPNVIRVDKKVDVEWAGWINHLRFSVYNYKNGPSWKGRPVEQLSGNDFHIGGTSTMVVKLVNSYLRWKQI